MNDKIDVCILAAGIGSRMKSSKPKVLHQIAGKPMLGHLLDTVACLHPHRTSIVIGAGAEQIKAAYPDAAVAWVTQSQPLGTGHAMQQAILGCADDARVLMLAGDVPLLKLATLRRLLTAPCDLGVLTTQQPNPFNYGRIIRAGDRLIKIVEEKDAKGSQKAITEINSGIMVADGKQLRRWLSKLDNNNNQQEYLLTDIVEIANKLGANVQGILTDDFNALRGVNNLVQLAELETCYQRRCAHELMQSGVHILDPGRFNLRGVLTAGQDVSIDINCIFSGAVVLGNQVSIGANCIIKDSTIGSGSVIKPNTMLDGAQVAEQCVIGPFARIRPGTELADKVSIGNFVETKQAKIGEGSKSGHLTYLGDAVIGCGVNIGAGTISCNYDGVSKFVTEISDNVFVGSNTALVAPVRLGEGATIAAGSVITKNVHSRSLGIARGRQKNIARWKGPKDK